MNKTTKNRLIVGDLDIKDNIDTRQNNHKKKIKIDAKTTTIKKQESRIIKSVNSRINCNKDIAIERGANNMNNLNLNNNNNLQAIKDLNSIESKEEKDSIHQSNGREKEPKDDLKRINSVKGRSSSFARKVIKIK